MAEHQMQILQKESANHFPFQIGNILQSISEPASLKIGFIENRLDFWIGLALD